MSSRDNALFALASGLEKKALEPVLLDLTGLSSYTDFILLLSGRSDRHVQNIAEGIVEAFAKNRPAGTLRPVGVEGIKEGHWGLIDFGDVVIHVFHHPVREMFDLEGLWCDAPRVDLDVPREARLVAGQGY